ncbi:5-dehydro-4-deoxy-D-glucuronate isomerase [Paenibacillus daejeonensis]|uniref:5-dehydro-4-deoxy-D-glucuronate isomerase n=1 Tax=Paenibacillus daejeonensis TaxID=135193 RepID=UPI000367BEE6|nr:5-dehydro-4-deoxy-D-glucuronate isomerase [Paenibacillus daejeonensis]
MQIRHTTSPKEAKGMDTTQLRDQFLIEKVFEDDQVHLVYSHYDRLIIGGAQPVQETLTLTADPAWHVEHFFERREAGIINIGGPAAVTVDGETYELGRLDALYIGRGSREITLSSTNADSPAKLYITSAPAHADYPTTKMAIDSATPNELGSIETSNERTIYQYIHEGGTKSCQLMLGVTILKPGSVWNTMPAHVHDRRMEAYLYFDLKEDARVFHLMGEPEETRHLVVAGEQAVISPSWSIHSGAGTSNYSFIWAMAGENYTFKDMDFIDMKQLK